MGSSRLGRVFELLFLIISCQSFATETKRTSGSIHVPIVRSPASERWRRSPTTGSIGLGDYADITYTVQIQVGETHIPVVLDTGSSDLWVLSTQCKETCPPQSVPLYPLSTFRPAHRDATLIYGDSTTGTYARGPIGSDFVSVAGLGLQSQYFAAINSTNTSVLRTDSAGILGLGFPFNSLFWIDASLGNGDSMAHRDVPAEAMDGNVQFPKRLKNLVTRWFSKNDQGDGAGTSLVDSMHKVDTTAALQSSIASYGPLIPRLVAEGKLDYPLFSITLQRDAIEIGGNEGMLSIGQLPPTVSTDSLTWVSVRGYPPSHGGLNPPLDAPGEVYAIAWEIPLDDVWFDGIKLERSKLSSPNISLSALIDTGNSLIRGPPDVVQQIHDILGGPRFACSPPHTLQFQIGGKLFPVDPRDFISEVRLGDPDLCAANVVPTDVPAADGSGYMYSWNLGDPFLKGYPRILEFLDRYPHRGEWYLDRDAGYPIVMPFSYGNIPEGTFGLLAAFHYGSLTRPSQNPPRIGLLSTVDLNTAGKLLCDDKHKAEREHEGYPMIVEPAPGSLPPARGTGVGGVPLAAEPMATKSGTTGRFTNGVSEDVQIRLGVWTVVLAGCVAWITWRTIG